MVILLEDDERNKRSRPWTWGKWLAEAVNDYQALLLLGIPEDEREKFILQHDVKEMTTRELD
jgi:hypothetical protein